MTVAKLIDELRELADAGYGDYEVTVTVDHITEQLETKLVDLVKRTVKVE